MTGSNRATTAAQTETDDGHGTVSRLGGILEIDVNGIEGREWANVEDEIEDLLAESSFGGHGVVLARPKLGDRENATRVSHFGHSINCEADDCEPRRDDEEVYRLFGARMVVMGDADSTVFGTYRLADGIQLDITSLGHDEAGTEERDRG